jgi:hypothetical protein
MSSFSQFVAQECVALERVASECGARTLLSAASDFVWRGHSSANLDFCVPRAPPPLLKSGNCAAQSKSPAIENSNPAEISAKHRNH